MQQDADEYFRVWNPEQADPNHQEKPEELEQRKAAQDALSIQYYNLVTSIFQKSGRMCGHLCRLSPNEPMAQSLVRHEHYLAHRVNIQEGEKILDVGCGIGNPARSIARFTGANITGLNINAQQLRQARQLTQEAGLGYQVNFVEQNFLRMEDFAAETFDGAYAIESTCYAPDLVEVYSEIFRVLKPGARFGVYEALLTDKYDEANPVHREVKTNIERGGGLARIHTSAEAIAAMKAVGFEILAIDDLGARPDQIPWETQLSDPTLEKQGWLSFALLSVFFAARASPLVNRGLQAVVGKLEQLTLFPAGSQKVVDLVVTILDGMYRGGALGIFSPMFLIVARKPEA
ncbi:putative sterol 24-c-methyltransferase [Aspergillus brunneoviolaceus CBS 621.78]|uniref:Sterol 24-c-methyltransferase n=1 Tax=Aspergillus brunneoviolaceus CBS 621.78 TaxID=1450534 RepID=A0ACD1GPQ8_9EURO|nr:putative sterol 24-c-methyltransferase [Aspergillus brunneoviolaceus CBS 621.78]RAH51230.1 putative sterol 24-c-methyltransferase [Aspergillus brunneoviolaceus CBS 621.78]